MNLHSLEFGLVIAAIVLAVCGVVVAVTWKLGDRLEHKTGKK